MDANYYNTGWESEWDDMKQYGPFSRHLRRLLISQLHKISFKSLLDVGCGQGSFLYELQNIFPDVDFHGSDFSSSALDLASKKISNCEFNEMDITSDLLDRKFDVVICSEVLEHIENDEVAINNLCTMTQKFLLVSSPQGRMRKFEERVVGHVRNYAKGELVEKLISAGVEPLDVIEWGFPFYSPLYRNYLELTNAYGTSRKFNSGKKLISNLIYNLFLCNSSRRGDEIIILSRVVNN